MPICHRRARRGQDHGHPILAKSLNCLGADGQGGVASKPCGVCQACTDMSAGRFIDYTELDAA